MTTRHTSAPHTSTPTPPVDRRELGRAGEALAERYLSQRGAVVLDRNWRCREGEIDLVVADDGDLVVVEVKTRRSNRFGRAAWAVTDEKYRRLRRLAAAWVEAHQVRVNRIRVDVIGIEWDGDRASIDHRRGGAP